jgi:serine/threonine protein kinase
MSGGEERHGPRARDLAETVRATDADPQKPRDPRETTVDTETSARPGSSRGVASYCEFADALVEVGLINAADLKPFTANSDQGVLGLSRALVKAGKLTPYQAAAVYQKKSRGLLIGKYLILDKLGEGGMGVVFKARHRTLGRLGALKILPPSFTRDRGAVMRFRREFEAAGRLRHVNVVAAFEADEDRGVHYLVMDYVNGINLDCVVGENGPLPVAEAINYVIQAARGLEAAHEKGIVHRDIKPANLMLDRQGTVRVLDLGLARIVDAGTALKSSISGRLTQTGMYMGTIDFMAPEQAEDSHNVDHRADIYSLGCTFHFLLTGREPFPGPTILKRMVAHQEHPPPSLRAARADVSPALEAAYQRMMCKRPEDRPASMSEVIALLQAAMPLSDDSLPVAPPPEPKLTQAAISPRPLERRAPPRTAIGSAIFARRALDEDRVGDQELSLRDLVMDVRSDVYGPGETCADRDESEGTSDVPELSLRELAQELGEESPRANAPKPPGANLEPLKRAAAPQQGDTRPGVLIPPADAKPLTRTPEPRKERAPAAGPAPPAAKPLTKRHDTPPGVPVPPADAKLLPRVSGPRQERAPVATPKALPAERLPLEHAAAMRADDSARTKMLAVLAVVTVILLVVAVVVSVARRPPVASKSESSKPAQDSAATESPSDGAPGPPP